MTNDSDMGRIFYDEIKNNPKEKKAFNLDTFMEETSMKKLLFFSLKLLIIPLVIALGSSFFMGGGFVAIFLLVLVVMLIVHIISFVKTGMEYRL